MGKIIFNNDELQDLKIFFLQLEKILIASQVFEIMEKKSFYSRYVKTIKFIPNFAYFGFSQYYIYIDPISLADVNLKLLLSNTFQSIKYYKLGKNITPVLIKYIYPHHDPNSSYLNWLFNTKRVIREYYLFYITKINLFLNIEAITSPSEKEYNVAEFKKRADEIIATPRTPPYLNESIIKTFDCDTTSDFSRDNPNSKPFKSLLELYGRKSSDLSSILSIGDEKRYHLENLLPEGLIFPYLSFKSKETLRKIDIILFNEKLTNLALIRRIFTLFPHGHIFEIKGNYFNKVGPKTKNFNNGLLIKVQIPQDKIKGFIELFQFLFKQLHIQYYKILTNAESRSDSLHIFFEDINFYTQYNPLKNFNWNENKNVWENHRVLNFGSKG